MKTQYELIKEVLNDGSVDKRFKIDERKKLVICNKCPDKLKCWDCGVHEWWIQKGRQPAQLPR